MKSRLKRVRKRRSRKRQMLSEVIETAGWIVLMVVVIYSIWRILKI